MSGAAEPPVRRRPRALALDLGASPFIAALFAWQIATGGDRPKDGSEAVIALPFAGALLWTLGRGWRDARMLRPAPRGRR